MIDRIAYFHALLRVVPGEHVTPSERARAVRLLADLEARGIGKALVAPEDEAFVQGLDERCKAGAATWAADQMQPVGSRAARDSAARETILARCRAASKGGAR